MNRGPVKLVGSKKHKNPPISFYINTAASDSREIINKCQCASSPGNHNSTIRLSKWGVVCFGSQGLPLSSHLPFNVLCFTALPNLCVFECLAWGCILYWVPWGSDLKDLFHPLTKKKKHLCSLHPEEHSCPMQPQDVITWPGDYAQQPTFDRLLIVLCLCIFTSLAWPLNLISKNPNTFEALNSDTLWRGTWMYVIISN